MLPSVFISYSHKDTDFGRRLAADLRLRVRSVWFDERSIGAGRRWDSEIEKGIREADVLLSLLSPNYLDSENCKDEFSFADGLGKPIIPLLVLPCDYSQIWMRIQRRQWIDFRANYSTAFAQLLEAFAQHLSEYRIPTSRTCPVCSAISETNSAYCPNGHAFRPSRLGELYGLPPATLQAYLKIFQPLIPLPNAGTDDLLAVALIQLMLRSFDITAPLLERVLQLQPSHAYAWYASALASLKGRRPRLLTRDEALVAQTRALNALNCDQTQSHAALLLALIKDDYFKSNGFRMDRPSIEECINLANSGRTTGKELRALLTYAPVTDGPLALSIYTAITQ